MGKGLALVLVLVFLTASFIIVDKPVSAASAPVADSWEERAPMHVGRGYLGVAAVNGKIYALGGTFSDSTQPLSINEEYDSANDSWTFKKPMPTERCMFAVVVYQNKIYCI